MKRMVMMDWASTLFAVLAACLYVVDSHPVMMPCAGMAFGLCLMLDGFKSSREKGELGIMKHVCGGIIIGLSAYYFFKILFGEGA